MGSEPIWVTPPKGTVPARKVPGTPMAARRKALRNTDPHKAAKLARRAIRNSENSRRYVEHYREAQGKASTDRANFLTEAHDYGMTWDQIAEVIGMHPVAVRRLVSRRRTR